MSLDPGRDRLLEQRTPQRDGFVELVLKTQRLELLDPSVAGPAISRRQAPAWPFEEVLDRLSSPGGDDLERAHRGPGFAGLDEKDGLSRKVRARQLGHAQPGAQPRLPDQAPIYLDAGKAPA